ncbi:MAG: hypothetical protein JSS27_13910 [Planctomycetes bacterium]|nr:hypothetical protein [Planctomycetota bacterium]
MELNRNHYFIIGIVLLLLGLQWRLVDTFVLNEKASQFVAAQTAGAGSVKVSQFGTTGANGLRMITLPTWLGYALMSVGAVLILHSLALNAPGGAHK